VDAEAGDQAVKLRLPYIAWRDGKPRFMPGPRIRALGFKGEDLRHEDGSWFTLEDAATWARTKHVEIKALRKQLGRDRPHHTPPKNNDAVGYVYMIRCGDWIKVGYSTRPGNRIADIATSQPHRVTSIVVVPGSRRDEQRALGALKSVRLNGEWCAYTAIADAIMTRSMRFGRVITEIEGPASAARAVSLRETLSGAQNPILFTAE
jgi:hypothetical protein